MGNKKQGTAHVTAVPWESMDHSSLFLFFPTKKTLPSQNQLSIIWVVFIFFIYFLFHGPSFFDVGG